MKRSGRSVTLKDVAREAGVSATLVSQVLRGVEGALVSSSTRERILEAASRLQYRPNRLAQALVGGKTQTVAIWRHGLFTAFHAWVTHEAVRLAAQDDYEVIIRDFAAVRQRSVWIHSSDVDGILAHECVGHVRLLLDGAGGSMRPIVSMGVFTVPDCDHVHVDLYPAAEQALHHLLHQGARRVAFVAPGTICLQEPIKEPRLAVYTRVLQQAGLPARYIEVPDLPRMEQRNVLVEQLRAEGLPDALFCHDDDLALIAIRALHDMGVRTPDDVAVVGCDGIRETEYSIPAVSTIVQPVEDMCAHAWRLLRQRMENPALAPQEVRVEARFVVRESSQRA